MTRELESIKRKFRALMRAERIVFPMSRGRISAPTTQGVYLIFGPRGRVLHVGRTVKGRNGLRQRLKNHLQGQSSFTWSMFDKQGEMLRGTHSYAFIEEPNDRRRALLEAYAVGNLCPKHLGVGRSAE